ncbi:MAG: SurA N-terminal domain-containing protein [Limisphaerales bacterium]
MFQFIRKHQAWGAVFIGAVILSFIVFMNPAGNAGRRGSGSLGTIGGTAVGEEEYRRAARELHLEQALRGQRGAADRVESADILQRVFVQREAAALGIRVPDEAVAERIVELPIAQDQRTGRFSREAYDQFLASLQRETGLSRSDFEGYLKQGIALEQLGTLAGLSGTLVSPREASARYRVRNEQFSVQLVMFPASNQVANVDLSPEAVGRFYSNNLPAYRLPDQVAVSYVRFAATNFLAEGEQALAAQTNLAALLDAEYVRRGTDSFLDSAGQVMTAVAAQAKLREEFRQQLALEAARKQANAFANALYQETPSPDALRGLAAAQGLSAGISLPFTAARGPAELRVPPQFARAAFALTEAEPFGTPVVGQDGVYVFALKERIPAAIQPFEAVQARVAEDWKRNESLRLARVQAEQFAVGVTNAMGQGQTFEVAASGLGVAPLVLPPFSATTPSLPELGAYLALNEVLQAVTGLPAGRLTAVEPTADGAFVAYLQARLPAAETQMKAELPEFMAELRRQGGYAAFNEWVMRRGQAVGIQAPAAEAAPAAN